MKTNINRLLRLADLLRSLPRKNFDMETVGDEESSSKPSVRCGSVCCVLGWACAIHPDMKLAPGVYSANVKVRGEEFSAMDHAEAFSHAFGVGEEEAYRITHPDAPHQTPKAAARAVERLANDLAGRYGYEIV